MGKKVGDDSGPFNFYFFLILKKADPWGVEDLILLINERFQVPEN